MSQLSSPHESTNHYCEALGIQVPRLEAVRNHRDAIPYSLLIVALLERGGPITLEEAARRFEEAGIAPAAAALSSLKRCRPGRPPIYRDGDLYALDPHDHEADLWAFRLGLRPPKVQRRPVVRPEPAPLPSIEEPLTVATLEEAWKHGIPGSWSDYRIAICVLDAHAAAMSPAEVVAFIVRRVVRTRLSAASADYWRRDAITVREDGLWELNLESVELRSARRAAVDRVAMIRRWTTPPQTSLEIQEITRESESRREARDREQAALRRVLVHAFPAGDPQAAVLLDINRREIRTLTLPAEQTELQERLAACDYIAGVDIRACLRALGFDPEQRRLGDLGPPQKSLQVNKRGRTIRITTSMLIQGSCGISRPLGDERTMREYLRTGRKTTLRRRLEADAKSLFALYSYGHLHHTVRLRWGFLETRLPAPWVHSDEVGLWKLLEVSHDEGRPLEVVVGTAPGWADPWSRAQMVRVFREGYHYRLVDERGAEIDRQEIQAARQAADGDL